MKTDCRGLLLRIALAGLLLLASPLAPSQDAPRTVVLEGALLIDGTGRPPLPDSALVIEDGLIRSVGKVSSMRYPKDAEVVRMRGKTLMPALINLHGHLGLTRGLDQGANNYTRENIREQLKKYLAYGVGTVLSLGTDSDLIFKLRGSRRAGDAAGARLYAAGRGFGVPDGYPLPLADLPDPYRPRTAEEAREQMRELAAQSPDCVKIWVDDGFGRLPKMRPEIYAAIIDEAHRHHLRVVAHVFYLADAKALLEAGVDGFAHSIRDQAVDHELIDAMKAREAFLIPTLVRDESTFVFGEAPTWLDDPFLKAGLEPEVFVALRSPTFIETFRANPDLPNLKNTFEMAKKNLKALSGAGVTIGFGTDSGPPARLQGYFEHRELQLMVEAGLTPMQAIVSATRTASEILHAESEFGTLAPGKRAEFLVLDANPLENVHNTEQLSAVWQNGKPLTAIPAR